MSNIIIKPSFIYPNIPKTAYKFGSNKFPATILNETGDWRNFLVPEELQTRNGIESSACYVEAQQHSIASLQEKLYTELDKNYSARFNALLSDGSPFGGDPLLAAESIRKNDGLIPDIMMPFSDDISSWDEYHSWKGVNKDICIATGKDFLEKWKLNYDIVFERRDTLEYKYNSLREALKYSPCPLSVYGKVDSTGNYEEKPLGANDTHLLLAVYVDSDNCIWVFDTYAPFLKKLPANYDSDFCMRWSIAKITKEEVKKKSLWHRFVQWFLKEKLIYREFKIFNILNKKR